MSVKYAKLRCARSALAPLALDLHLLQVDWRCAHRCRRKDGLVEVDCAQRLSTHSWAASRNHVLLPPIVLTGLARHVVVEYVCVSNRVGLCVTCVVCARSARENCNVVCKCAKFLRFWSKCAKYPQQEQICEILDPQKSKDTRLTHGPAVVTAVLSRLFACDF